MKRNAQIGRAGAFQTLMYGYSDAQPCAGHVASSLEGLTEPSIYCFIPPADAGVAAVASRLGAITDV